MSDNVATDAETVSQAAVDCINTEQSVQGNLQRLKSLCDELAASWTGRGGAAFQNTMLMWDDNAAKLLDALNDIATALDSSAAEAAAQDDESSSDFSEFEGEL